jgi:hypothetical protein
MKTCTTCFVTSRFPANEIDESGQCQWCRSTFARKAQNKDSEINFTELKAIADTIKTERTGNYDCIIGVSGGLDSSYMTYVAGKLMGLNALLVHYDHGFYYDRPKENLQALAEDLGLELRIYRSKKAWDKKFVQAIMKALEQSNLYWGICTFCHYILPAVIVKVGMAERIKYFISHNNKYELSLNVPKQVKRDAMLKSVFGSPLRHMPETFFYLILANYYLIRLKFEFFIPPLNNLFRSAPKKPFKTINLTKYVPWDIKQMKEDLARDTGWRLPDHPNLGMRFDCMIEDSLVDLSYKKATGLSIHGIIANNLIYDGVNDKIDLNHIVKYYERNIDNSVVKIVKIAFDE